MMAIFCSWDDDIKDDFYPWKRYIKNDFYPGFDIKNEATRGDIAPARCLIFDI